jgi:hypothetical protein
MLLENKNAVIYGGGGKVGGAVALGAIDVLRRQLAVELGPHGIRVVTLQSGGVPEAIGDWLGPSPGGLSARPCSSGWRRWRTSATWPPSPPLTWPAP